jgi:hypothetical protein
LEGGHEGAVDVEDGAALAFARQRRTSPAPRYLPCTALGAKVNRLPGSVK